jgi:hypothetical protein
MTFRAVMLSLRVRAMSLFCLERASFVFTILRPFPKALGFLGLLVYPQTSPLLSLPSRTALMYISGWEGDGDISCYDYEMILSKAKKSS